MKRVLVALEYRAIKQAKEELDWLLDDAKKSIQAYIEDNSSLTELKSAQKLLHQAANTLQIMQVHGGVLLAREITEVVDALVSGKSERLTEAQEVVSDAVLRLGDYLEHVQAGHKDIPIVLLSLLNDLRAARNAPLLSENVLFFPEISNDALPELTADQVKDIGAFLRRARISFEKALLQCISGNDTQAAGAQLCKVLVTLYRTSTQAQSQRFWWAASALAQAIAVNGLPFSPAVASLLSSIDRQIKHSAEMGAEVFAKQIPDSLFKNILYYIAIADDRGRIVNKVKEAFSLNQQIPTQSEIEHVKEKLSGPNSEALIAVSKAVLEDLASMKDCVELFIHSGHRDTKHIDKLSEGLGKIADTLAMIGIEEFREKVDHQLAEVALVREDDAGDVDLTLLGVSETLLEVEHCVNNFINYRQNLQLHPDQADEQPSYVRSLINTDDAEHYAATAALLSETLLSLERFKEMLSGMLKHGLSKETYDECCELLASILGASKIAEHKHAEAFITHLLSYLSSDGLYDDLDSGHSRVIVFADCIVALQCYFEQLELNAPYADEILDHYAPSLAQLVGKPAAEKKTQGAESEQDLIEDNGDATMLLSALQEDALVPSGEEPSIKNELSDANTIITHAVADEHGVDAEALIDKLDAPVPELEDPDLSQLDQAFAFDLDPIDNEESKTEHASQDQSSESSEPSDDSATSSAIEGEGEFAVLAEGVDKEILDVFIEEADQVLAEMRKRWNVWNKHFELWDELVSIRRGFHTLKGSGRLVGAELLGEFAWQFENCCNNLTNYRPEINGDITDIISRGIDQSNELLAQLKEQKTPANDPYVLMAEVEQLAKQIASPEEAVAPAAEVANEKASEADAQVANEAADSEDLSLDFDMDESDDAESNLESVETSEPVIETQPASEEAIEAALEIDLSEIVDNPNQSDSNQSDSNQAESNPVNDETPVFEGSDDDAQENAIEVVDADGAPSSDDQEQGEQAIAEGEETPVDPDLSAIFTHEASQHLKVLRTVMDEISHDSAIGVQHELLRAIHTLKGNSRIAGAPFISEVCEPLETIFQRQLDKGLELDGDAIHLIKDSIEQIERSLAEYQDPEHPQNIDTTTVQRLEQLNALLREEISEQAETEDSVLDEPDLLPELEQASDDAPSVETKQDSTSEPVAEKQANADQAIQMVDRAGERDPELSEIFFEEAEDVLASSQAGLQSWLKNKQDVESVSELRRQLHTLKGSSRMADFKTIGELSHVTESLVVALVDGRIDASDSTDKLLQKAFDTLHEMLESARALQDVYLDQNLVDEILNASRDSTSEDIAGGTAKRAEEQPSPAAESSMAPESAAQEPVVQESVIRAQDAGSETEARTESESVETKEQQAPESEQSTTVVDATEDNVVRVRQFNTKPEQKTSDLPPATTPSSNEVVRIHSDELDTLVNDAGEVHILHSRFQQVMTEYGFNLMEMDATVTRLREQLRKLEHETEAQILFKHADEKEEGEGFDPLELDRYSEIQQLSRSLVESAEDLLNIKNMLAGFVQESEEILIQQERVTTSLQDNLLRTRMVQFNDIELRLQRILRQAAASLNKEADLTIQGGDTELDRSVLNHMMAPLEHLLRNAISHGIESPEDRKQANKRAAGSLDISVAREGSEIVITMQDDGTGIDPARVKKKAIDLGLLEKDQEISDEEAIRFILSPGFSTAEKVTQISGRGVGMDVVDNEIRRLGGSLQIKSELGKGTQFGIRLPFTLAVTQALLVRVGAETYALSLSGIEGVVRVSVAELKQRYASEQCVYHYAEKDYRLYHLGTLLRSNLPELEDESQVCPVLLVHVGEQRFALHVEASLGNKEIVVKSLAPQLVRAQGVSGATIMGDGGIALILDVPWIAQLAKGYERQNAVQPVADSIGQSERNPLVMVVDDSITIRKVTTRFLERNRYDVVTAKDGIDALQLLQKHTPDVILLDVEMPRMDGYEFASNVSKDEQLKDIPIIMITSRTGDKHRQRAMEVGVRKYLGKPYNETELLEQIQEFQASEV